jgi:hypothetical protein
VVFLPVRLRLEMVMLLALIVPTKTKARMSVMNCFIPTWINNENFPGRIKEQRLGIASIQAGDVKIITKWKGQII